MPNVPFDIQIGEGVIPGALHAPEAPRKSPRPAVMVCGSVPGSANDYASFVAELTDRLNAAGIAVAHFTARLDDEAASADAATLIDDAMAVFHWLQARDEVDSQRIGVVGLGLGAIIAAGLAGRTDQVGAVCLVAPGTNEEAVARLLKPNGAAALLAAERADARHATWIGTFGALTPTHDLAVHERPTLILRGSADRVVETVRPYVDAMNRADRHLEQESVVRADHEFADPELREVCLDRVEHFFREHGPAAAGASGRTAKNGKSGKNGKNGKKE